MGASVQRFSDIQPVSVPTDTLDNLFYAKNVPVHFIKIDTEGWEYNILRGGEQTLRTYKPIIQVEYSETNMAQCQVNPLDLENLWKSYGYTAIYWAGEEVLLVPSTVDVAAS